MSFTLRQRTPDEVALMQALLVTFRESFDNAKVPAGKRPSAVSWQKLLGVGQFIALVTMKADEVVGGIAPYEVPKFGQDRSEIY